MTDTPASPTCHVTMLTHRSRAGLNVYVLTAGEKRTADAQQAIAALAVQVAQLKAAGLDEAEIKHAVADVLAAQ